MVLMFLASTLTVAFNVTPVKALITSNVPISITTNFTLTDDYSFIGCDGFHIDADFVTLDLAGYMITGDKTGHIGILLNGRTGVTVKGGTIQNFEQGIWLLTSSNNVIKDNTIYMYTVGEGIWLDGSSDNIIEANTISGSSTEGIGLSDSLGSYSGNIVRYNNLFNRTIGIRLFDGTDNIVEGNTLSGSGNAIRVDAGYGGASNGNIITENICSGGYSAAIVAVNWRFPSEPWGSFSNIQMTCNDIINNKAGIYITGEIYAGTTYPVDATAFAVNYNNIVGNELYGAKNLGTGTLNARFNWWGDASGPYHPTLNPAGLGNKISDNVNFSPWLGFAVGHKYTYADYITAIAKAADRLVALQSSTDYGWDWIVTGLISHTSDESATNLYGVTALGLIDAYVKTGNATYLTAAKKTADFIKYGDASAGDFWIGHGDYWWGYSFDYKFLMEFSAEWGDPSYANYAQAAWAWQTSAASSPYITDLRYMDGNQSYLYNYFVTGPGGGSAGYGAWQASDYGLAAWEMGDTIWAQHMASVINSSINNIASATTCRDLGMAWALKLLWTVDKVTYATGISTLKTDLKNDQLPSGSWHDGNPDGDPQTTAYAVMGLLGAGEYSAARKGADWLIGTQLINGGWEASPDEYSEIDSEAAQASATSIVQLTVASAYDSPYPSIGTTSYLVGTSVTANVTSPASGSAGTQYVCTGWTGTGDVPASGTGTTVTFTINLDSNITWNWKTQYNITFAQSDVSTDFTGSVMNVNGTDYDRSGHSDWYDSGATINFSFYSPLVVPPGAKEYHWNSTSGLSSLQSGSIFVTGSGSVTGNYVTRVHDVAVTNVVANRTWVYQGKSCGFGVNVTVLNKGDFPETVNITLYYNITANQIIGTQTINLLPEESQTLAFMWNTIGVEYCHNYTLTAVANIIPLDNDPADNTFTDGKVKVRILGDINGDGIVDMKDITTIINAFGTTLGRPRWNPEADLNNDNVVDLKDVTIALRNYGKTE